MQRALIAGFALATFLGLSGHCAGQYAANPNWNEPTQLGNPAANPPRYPLYQSSPAPQWSPSAWGPANGQGSSGQPSSFAPQPEQAGDLGIGNPLNAIPSRTAGSAGRPADGATPYGAPQPPANWNSPPSGYSYGEASCATGQCGGPTVGLGQSYFAGIATAARRANWVVGMRALAFQRTYEDSIGLSVVPGDPSQYLTSRDADFDVFGGGEIYLRMRHCCGWGWEFGYWGLFADKEGRLLRGSPNTVLSDLADLTYVPTGQSVLEIYNAADFHLVNRENEFHNLELNFLKNAHCVYCLGRPVNVEWLCGFRYLKFDERFEYFTYTTLGGYPSDFAYILKTENNLLGFQLGCRTDHCILRCLRLNVGSKFGVYGNRIDYTQFMHCDGTFAQVIGGPFAGSDYAVSGRGDTVSFLGELDLGLNYQFAKCWRANFGYRALAVCGVALAPDQIPSNFSDLTDIKNVNSSGCLILHGAYLGLERCF